MVAAYGLRGDIYYIPSESKRLPVFEHLWPVGKIYAQSLNIPLREFTEGFPGVTSRFEWFAIDYKGKFWIEKPGNYGFSLISDDGSRLYIDDKIIVDNDGIHGPVAQEGVAQLKPGLHRIRVCYFQGPRTYVALVLGVAPPKQTWRVFDMNEYKPPPDSDYWKTAKPGDLSPDR